MIPRWFPLVGGMLAMSTGLFLLGGMSYQTLATAWGGVFFLSAVITTITNLPD